MTDFYSVLQRAVASLPDGSGPNRRAVYDKARKALLKQLQSFDPPLPSADVTAQRLALEDAIRKIENEIARQIRTQRALQTAMPASRSPNPVRRPAADAGENGAAAAAASAAAAKAAEAERAAQRAAEAERARREQADLLANAVSEATLDNETETLRHTAPVPVKPQREPAPFLDEPDPHDDARMFEAEAEDYDDPRRFEPADERDDIVDGEYDEVDGEDDHEDETDARAGTAPAVEPRRERRSRKDEKRARKEEERRLKAERRAAKSKPSRKAARGAPPADTGRRKKSGGGLGRVVLPIVLLALLAGAAYAAYTQREALLAVLDELQQDPAQRPPITVTGRGGAGGDSGAAKNSDRLPSTLDGEETRTVTTTTWPPGGDASAGEETADDTGEGTGEGTGDGADAAPAGRQVGADVSPYAPDTDATTAEDRVASVQSPIDTDAGPDEGAEASDNAEETDTASLAPADQDANAASEEQNRPAPVDEFTSGGTQQAVLYEEAAQAGEQGTAVPGGVEWSMVRESIGGGDPEAIIRATAEVPERNMTATITVRENQDGALPASHLIEIEFEVPDGFEGGGVKNVPGVIMKQSEQSRGEALRGAAARVSSGLFWIALSENEADRESNLALLRDRDWIDIPILYESGRRAILTLRKGSDGYQSINSAIQAWKAG